MYKDKNLYVIFIQNQCYKNIHLINMYWERSLEFPFLTLKFVIYHQNKMQLIFDFRNKREKYEIFDFQIIFTFNGYMDTAFNIEFSTFSF